MTSREIVAPDCVVLGLLLLALLSGSPSATSTRVHVAAGELESPIIERLTAELPGSIATSTASADLLLSVVQRADELEVTIRDQLGRPVLTRTVSLVEGLTPALRRIVLVVAHAVENTSELAPPTTETRAEVTPPKSALPISVSAELSLAWWTTSAVPQLGASVAVLVAPSTVDFGLRITFAGEPCCRRTGRGISADARELAAIAEAGFRALDLGDASLRLHAGLGLGWMSLDVRPDAFQGSPSATRVNQLAPIAELGAMLALDVLPDQLSIQVSAGGTLRPLRLEVALPDDTAYDASDLDPGLFNPWIRAGAAVNFL